MNFDKTSTKTATCNSKKFPATQRKKTAQLCGKTAQPATLLVTELHALLMTSHAITIGACPAESCDYVCLAPLRHYRNIPSRFSYFAAIFSSVTNKNLQQDHCSSICNALMTITR